MMNNKYLRKFSVLTSRHFEDSRTWCSQPAKQFKMRTSFSRLASVRVTSQTLGGLQGKLVTAVGKGGSGKTTALILLAKYHVGLGRKVLFVTQSEDLSAEEVLGAGLARGSKPEQVSPGLDGVRVYATKLAEDPWRALKQSEEQFAFAGGILNEMTVDELPMLPGLDMFAVLGVLRKFTLQYDVVVYDGPSSSEILRLLATPSKLQWYLQRLRRALSQSDAGRLILPTLINVMENMLKQEAISVEGRANSSSTSLATSSWDRLTVLLNMAADSFSDPKLFSCYLVVNQCSPASLSASRRLWVGAMQACTHVGGVLVCDSSCGEDEGLDLSGFGALPVARLPALRGGDWDSLLSALPPNWDELSSATSLPSAESVTVSGNECAIKFFLPGLEKAEVRLTQRLSNQEILVDTCGQRHIVSVPQGFSKVTGAKFEDGYLNVTLTGKAA